MPTFIFPGIPRYQMLAGRGLPTVPEEDFFPDVEDTAGLPPSSSPPSVSTPTPTAHTEYSSRHSSLTHPFSNQPSSPQLYSPQETYIPSRDSTPQAAHVPPISPHIPPISPQHLTTSEQDGNYELRQEGSHRPFSRSRSAQDLHARSSDPKDSPQQESHVSSFAVPKSIPKKKYYGGSSSNWTPLSPISTTGSTIMGTNSLVFNSPVSPTSQSINTLPEERQHHPQISHSHSVPLSVFNAIEIHTPTTESNIFAHILSSDSYIPPNSQPLPSPPQISSKIKVARISPRPYPDVTSSPSSLSKINSNNIGFSSSNNSDNIRHRNSCNSNSITVVSGNHHQPNLLPNVSLSAVTPSSIKSIQHHATSAPVSSWSSSSRSLKILKASPPYPEPNSPSSAQTSASSPPSKPFRPKNDAERVQYKEHRRVCHINAEQKRRCNIKNNFEMLHSLVPAVNQNPNAKVSKATMLHKGAEYIMQMKQEKKQLNEQTEQLKNQIETLSAEISLAQSMLPATGAGMRPTRHNKIKEKFDAYVRERTLANPKYYVLALIAQPLLQTYNSSVSTASVDDLCRSSMAWLDQHCSLNVLRPVVSNAMRKLSVTTNILTTPETLYEDIFRQVTKQEGTKYSQFTSTEPR